MNKEEKELLDSSLDSLVEPLMMREIREIASGNLMADAVGLAQRFMMDAVPLSDKMEKVLQAKFPEWAMNVVLGVREVTVNMRRSGEGLTIYLEEDEGVGVVRVLPSLGFSGGSKHAQAIGREVLLSLVESESCT